MLKDNSLVTSNWVSPMHKIIGLNIDSLLFDISFFSHQTTIKAKTNINIEKLDRDLAQSFKLTFILSILKNSIHKTATIVVACQ